MFFTLLKFEFKKLLKKKSVWICLAVSLLCLPMSLFANVLFYKMSIDTERGSLNEGYYAVLKADTEQDKELSGRVIDDNFIEFLHDAEKVAENGEDYDKNSPEYIKYVRAYDNAQMYILQMSGYTDEKINDGELYRIRSEYMENDWTDNCLTDGEKQYLKSMEDKVDKPFVYRYCRGYDIITSGISMCGILLFAVSAICVPGIFTEDRRTKADRVVLSSKHGKTMVYGAKTAAAALFCAGDFLFSAFMGVILSAIFFGFEGFDAPLQMLHPMLPFDLTCGEAALILAGMGIAEGVIMSALCMIISELTGSGTPAVVAMAVLFVNGSMLTPDPSHRVLARLWDMLPFKITMWDCAFSVKLFHIGKQYFAAYQTAPILYFLICAVLVFCGYRHYRNYQPK